MGPASRRPEPLAFAPRTREVIQQILTSQNVIFVNSLAEYFLLPTVGNPRLSVPSTFLGSYP